jgi:hypothetical protein
MRLKENLKNYNANVVKVYRIIGNYIFFFL